MARVMPCGMWRTEDGLVLARWADLIDGGRQGEDWYVLPNSSLYVALKSAANWAEQWAGGQTWFSRQAYPAPMIAAGE